MPVFGLSSWLTFLAFVSPKAPSSQFLRVFLTNFSMPCLAIESVVNFLGFFFGEDSPR